MIHVVHVLHSLGIGGTENGVANLINGLDAGFRHTLVSMTHGGAFARRLPAGVDVYCLGKRPGHDVRTFWRLFTLLRRLRPDVVHSRNWGTFDAIVAARLAGVPSVVHGEHGRDIMDPEGRNRLRNALRWASAPLVSRFVAVSSDLRAWFVCEVGISANRVVAIPNGVDTKRFEPGEAASVRARLGLPLARPTIGTVARLDPVKDHSGLLRAFADVRKISPDALLVIAGDGPCRDGLRAEAVALGVGRDVVFLGERTDVPSVLAALDVFVLPSIAEGMSNTLLEAMATGLPVVASRVGGNPELVEDGVNGLLVPPRDHGALAKAILRYLEDPYLTALHGKSSRARAVEQFSLDRMRAAYAALYVALGPARRSGEC